MKHKRAFLGFVASFTALAVGISIANYSSHSFSQRATPVIYDLVLNSSNRITTSSSSTERSISTASGNWAVKFNYTNVSPIAGGHCAIENGGKLVNSDHILSIEELTINFSTSGTLRFRTSYDATTWGVYNDAVSGHRYTLSSHPYYVEFSALNAKVDLNSVSYGYTCTVNEEAEGSTGDSLLGVIDFWNPANVGNTGNSVEMTTSYVNDRSYSNLEHTTEINVASNVSGSKAYQNRYGGIGLGSSGNDGTLTISLMAAYHVDKIAVVGLGVDDDTANLKVSGSSATAVSKAFTIKRSGISSDIEKAQTLEYVFSSSQSSLTFATVSKKRLAIYRIMLYAKGTVSSAPSDEVGFTATDSNASKYTESSVFDTDNGLIVAAKFSDGTTSSLSKCSGNNNYSYIIKNASNEVVSSSSSFGSVGLYTLIISYKTYIAVHINLTVGVDFVGISSIEAILMEDEFTINDTLTLNDNLLVDVFYGDGSSASNLEYTDLSSYGLGLSLITPGGVNHNIGSAFGVEGTWTVKIFDSSNPSVYYDILITVVDISSPLDISKTTMAYDYDDYTNYNEFNIDSAPSNGNPKLLVIPIWFTDSNEYITSETRKANVLADIEDVYFGTPASTGWHSVSSFYYAESQGKVNLNGGTVSDWYEVGESTAFYGDADEGEDRTTDLVEIATNWYFTNNPSDSRSNYDTNDDGFLDGVMLIYGAPDYSAARSSYDNLWAYCFWVQKPTLRSITNPGPNVFFWASYDFMYDSAKATNRAGTNFNGGDTSHCNLDSHTFTHEMGHVFGLEDYYDYSKQYKPAGGFSMQDYNVGGHDPYSVMALGWADPYIPTTSGSITIGAFQTTHDLILLTPSWNSYDSPFDEYLLLELYTPTGLNEFDSQYQYSGSNPKGPSTSGIRLWHVDARLTTRTGNKYSYDLHSNVLKDNVTHVMSNTYYKSNLAGYFSPLGEEYTDYNLLQLIRNKTTETYTPTASLTANNLFTNGQSFDMNTFASQFVNSGKLNSNINLGWSFTVEINGSGASATATIALKRN